MTMVLDEAGRPRLARDLATSDVALESAGSAVSWGAIIGGAVAAAAVSLLLLLLGSGIGLTVVSPWGTGASLTTVAASALIWMIVVHWIGSAVGGYLTGRLRTPWAGVHAHEVTFRDTANGFLTWGLAVLLVAALAGMSASAVLFSGVQATATVAAGAAQGAAQQSGGIADPTAYFVDTLFRPATPATAPTTSGATAVVNTDVRTEVSRILVKDIAADQFPADDRAYLADLVVARTGLPADVAKMRVDSVVTALNDTKVKAKAAADAARKAAATAALGLVLALLIGAFVASAAAALGGHMRDHPNYPR